MPIFPHPEKLLALSNGLLVFAAVLTVVSTISVIYFGNRVAMRKEAELKAYQKNADIRIAEANDKTEQEHVARMKIEARLSGRRISKEKHDQMVAILKRATGSVIVGGLYGVEESRTFAIDIKGVFDDAGWTAVLNLTGSSSNPPVGVACKADISKPAGLALKTAMRLLPDVKVVEIRYTDNKDTAGVVAVGIRTPP